MRMLNKYATPNQINLWLSEISQDTTKDIRSVSLVNDGDSDSSSYILVVILYEEKI